MNSTHILTLSCPDRTGIVHAVSGFLLERGGNIEEAAQYNDPDTGLFFMRVQFSGPTPGEALRADWGWTSAPSSATTASSTNWPPATTCRFTTSR